MPRANVVPENAEGGRRMVDVIVVNLAYVALLSAAFTKTLGRLRLLLIAGATGFVAFGLIEQIWSIVIWNLLIGGIHTFRFVRDLLAARSVHLDSGESAVRDRIFPGVSDFDFNMLWSLGEEVTYDTTQVIARGSVPDTVSLVMDGVVHIKRDGETLRHLRSGALLGEMSFVTGDEAAVDVVADGRLVVHQWDQRSLKSLGRTHPPSLRVLEALISKDLAAKAHI